MTKAAFLLTLIATALATPAHAQQRVFVSGTGVDTNPCTLAQPCRTFQQAHNVATANAEIDVLDPAGYGPLTITKGSVFRDTASAGSPKPLPAQPPSSSTSLQETLSRSTV
jgi:hypothetical protein